MKLWSVFLFLVCHTLLEAQQIQFRNTFIDTIEIRSSKCEYNVEINDDFYILANKLSISYDTLLMKYDISNYQHENLIVNFDSSNYEQVILPFDTNIVRTIDVGRLKELIDAFSTRKMPMNILPDVDSLKFIRLVNRNIINDFVDDFNDQTRSRPLAFSEAVITRWIRDCRSLDTFRVYLSEGFDTTSSRVSSEGPSMIYDRSESFRIRIMTANMVYSFVGEYPNPVKQPWYERPDSLAMGGLPIINLDINSALYALLPDDFLSKETISFDGLITDYMLWYLRRNVLNRTRKMSDTD